MQKNIIQGVSDMSDKTVIGTYIFSYMDHLDGELTAKTMSVLGDGTGEHVWEIKQAFDSFLRGCGFVLKDDDIYE